MEQIFNLDASANRPIILLDNIFNGCTALIDTGALFPIWTKDVRLLEALGAELVKKNVNFGGFGGDAEGDIYKITLDLGKFIYPNMHIIACRNDEIPGFFIFSATMFKHAIYTIDDITKKFIVKTIDNQICRNLIIKDTNGKLSVLSTSE